jgi:hypothetical protein
MTLSRRIAAALDDPTVLAGAPPHHATAEQTPHRLSLAVRVASPVGVEVESFELSHTDEDRPDRSLDDLKARADRVAARVTYLMEPLRLIEADAQGVEVELRSAQPTARDGRRAYYEVRLNRRGTLRLARVVFDESDRSRTETPFQLTREVLDRLVDDLVATAD